jgi:hypothetical protein
MEVDYVGRLIRQSKRVVLVEAALLLAICAVLLTASWETVYYRNRPAQPLQQQLLTQLGRPSWRTYRYVIVTLKGLVETGYQVVRTRHGDDQSKGKPVSDIVLVYIGNTPIICEIPVGFTRSVISGGLTGVPRRIRNRVALGDILPGEDAPWDRAIYYFKGHDQDAAAYVFFFLGVVGLGFFAYTAFLAQRWFLRPETHPIVRSVSRFGEFNQVSAEIDNEINHTLLQQGAARFLPSWIIQGGLHSVVLLRYDDLIWTHVKRTNEYRNYVYQGTSWTLMMYDRHGDSVEAYLGHTSKKKMDNQAESKMRAVEELLKQKAPWTIKGYTEAAERLIKENAGNLDGLLARLKMSSDVRRT